MVMLTSDTVLLTVKRDCITSNKEIAECRLFEMCTKGGREGRNGAHEVPGLEWCLVGVV